MTFLNYGKPVSLTQLQGGHYQVGQSGQQVQLASRLIVKTAPQLSKEQLLRLDRQIIEVTLVYQMQTAAYFQLRFAANTDLQPHIERLSRHPQILLVQPDMLQLASKHGQKTLVNFQPDYIRALGINRLWESTKGKGVKVAVIDDGFQLDHEDLVGVKLNFGYDTNTRTLDPSPRHRLDVHGTQVVGVIFAQHNQIGINGIAPQAELIAIRQPDTWTSKTLLSFYLTKLAKADVLNCSWQSPMLLQPVEEVVRDLIKTGRGGKGMVVVFSAGNHGKALISRGGEGSIEGVVTVGSADRFGKPLTFSNYGQSVAVYTFGRGIKTTSNNKNKQYVPFAGTSASAALISGLSALMLAKDPTMTLAQLKQNLAKLNP